MTGTLKNQIDIINSRNKNFSGIFHFQKDFLVLLDDAMVIHWCNAAALRFLSSFMPTAREDIPGIDATDQLNGENLLTYLRSSELNELFDSCRKDDIAVEGNFSLFSRNASYRCYIQPVQKEHLAIMNHKPESGTYLLCIYRD